METVKEASKLVDEYVRGNKKVDTSAPVEPTWDNAKHMHCLVWNGKLSVDYEEHARPCITDPRDVLVRVTAASICGSDIHHFKGSTPGMRKGDILGHEFVGIVEEAGMQVKQFKKGDRVVVSWNIACGACSYCQRQEYTACDRTNPSVASDKLYGNRPAASFAHSHFTGGVPGGQAEFVRVPFADVNCYALPEDIPDEKAVLLSDVVPTAYHAVTLGDVGPGRTVGIWGLGPVGLMCARICQLKGAARVIGVDCVPERLSIARDYLGIDVINFEEESVLERISVLFDDGLDVAIECAGFDYVKSWAHKAEMTLGLETDTAEIFNEIFLAVRKYGNVSVVGLYVGYANHFNVGAMLEKCLSVRCGLSPVQRYWAECTELIRSGTLDPSFIVTHKGKLADGPEFYRKMDAKMDGFIKCCMRPAGLVDSRQAGKSR
ncbi:GroES-like protein [Aphelenchoides avenae]|nr:GroES-like protein [Aphelenchus avenae]